MKFYLDRFEEGLAVLISETDRLSVPAGLLPAEAEEGDTVYYEDGSFIVDKKDGEDRWRRIQEKMRAFFPDEDLKRE